MVFSGNDDCFNTTGLFCQSSFDTCSTFPACSVDDGSFPNSETCSCGNNVCNPNEFCDAKQALLSADNNPCYPLDCGMTPEDMLEQMPNCFRFNNRFDLRQLLPKLALAEVNTPPMPYRLLKLAEPSG